MSAPRVIGFIGDTHCGSHCGLWPVKDLHGTHPQIKYLMSCYTNMVKAWPKLDLLVLMGDLIDGRQPKGAGVGLLTTDLGEQAAMAAKVLEPAAAKASKIIRVWGTPYHETFDSILKIVDVSLGVCHVAQVIDVGLGKHNLNVAHHPASGTALYQGTVVDRESLWSQIAAHEGHTPDARWIVRAHKHSYFYQETRRRTIVMMPCWQLPTAHAKKVNYWRFQASIGGLLMQQDNLHDSGYRFTPTLFDGPTVPVIPYGSLGKDEDD